MPATRWQGSGKAKGAGMTAASFVGRTPRSGPGPPSLGDAAMGPSELSRQRRAPPPVERVLCRSRLLPLELLGDVGIALLAQVGHLGLELLAIGPALGDCSAELL